MKWLRIRTLPFLLGVVFGMLIHAGILAREERQKEEKIAAEWRSKFPTWVDVYCNSTNTIPLPPHVALSDLTWPDLAFWLGYARGYELSEVESQPSSAPMSHKIFGPYRGDLLSMEKQTSGGGAELGYQARELLKQGYSLQEVQGWVATTYSQEMAAKSLRDWWKKMLPALTNETVLGVK